MRPPSTTPQSSLPQSSSLHYETPLTAERAMMDQIRSKLERAQRRLARHQHSRTSSFHSMASSTSTAPSSDIAPKPVVKSVLLEAIRTPTRSSNQYASRSSRSNRIKDTLPSLRSTLSPSRSHRGLSSVTSDSLQSLKSIQYKSKSKYSQGSGRYEADPLNGGPPPLATPYLVYSNSRLSIPKSRQDLNSSRRDMKEHEKPLSSALRSGISRPPSSRVRFVGHEKKSRDSSNKNEREKQEMERKRCQEQMKEREARRQRHREKELNKVQARAKGLESSLPIAATARSRRSVSIEHPPSSAIKLSAYDAMVQALPMSPVGRLRRSSIGNPPPKSDIKISAFDDVNPRRRTSQDKQIKLMESKQQKDETVDVVVANTVDRQKVLEQVSIKPTAKMVVPSPLPSIVPEPDVPNSSFDGGDGDTSANETDDSYDYEFSDFDTDTEDTPSGYLVAEANGVEVDIDLASDDDDVGVNGTSSRAADDKETPSCSATALSSSSIVKEEKEDEQHLVSRLTARDLALHALGRASTCSFSDLGSPDPSTNGRDSLHNIPGPKVDTSVAQTTTPAPMSYTPASSAFPSAHALGRRVATTGRTRSNRILPPTASTSVSSYVRRSQARAPMDLKNHLPPSIGVLSDLSSGSSTFVMNSSHFYDVTWRSGEFAFSVQRVYTEKSEYEFDDCNQESQLFLRMLLNTERSTCKSFSSVRVGDVLIRVGDTYVSDLGLEGSGTVLTKFFAKLIRQTPIRLTFQRMSPCDWEGGVEL